MMTVAICTVRDSACGRVLADYKPSYYWWDCLEMLRKAILTGILVIRVSLCRLLLALFNLYLLTLRGSVLTPVRHFCASQMFFKKGSLTQLVVAMVTSLGELVHFGTLAAERLGSNSFAMYGAYQVSSVPRRGSSRSPAPPPTPSNWGLKLRCCSL